MSEKGGETSKASIVSGLGSILAFVIMQDTIARTLDSWNDPFDM